MLGKTYKKKPKKIRSQAVFFPFLLRKKCAYNGAVQEELTMPKIDKDLCIGCGMCMGTRPAVFNIGDDGKAEVIGSSDDEASIQEAIANCPVGAISED